MNEFKDLTSRLQALGDNPVPPPVATQHLNAMAEVSAPRSRFAQKVRVVAAFGVGILVGGTGLGYAAAEGHLPDAAQNGLSVAAEKVGFDLPRGDEKKSDKAEGAGEGSEPLDETVACDDANGMTHGGFVSSNVKDARDNDVKGNASELAKSDCGKDGGGEIDDAEAEEESDEGGAPEDKGKPEDPGKPEDAGKPDAAGAGEVEDDGEDDDEDDEDEEEGEQGPPDGIPPVTPGGDAPEDTPAP